VGTILVLALALAQGSDRSQSHVRSSEPRIVALVEKGMAQSETFRRLVAALDASDVVVYVDRKQSRPALGGYLPHDIVNAGNRRYLHVSVDIRGAEVRLVALLAHELQHAVEVAQAPEVRDPKRLAELFMRLALPFGCGETDCSETQAAKEVEWAVTVEMKAPSRGASKRRGHATSSFEECRNDVRTGGRPGAASRRYLRAPITPLMPETWV